MHLTNTYRKLGASSRGELREKMPKEPPPEG
jgi:DNA-binding CsgD family transcriptional regulator